MISAGSRPKISRKGQEFWGGKWGGRAGPKYFARADAPAYCRYMSATKGWKLTGAFMHLFKINLHPYSSICGVGNNSDVDRCSNTARYQKSQSEEFQLFCSVNMWSSYHAVHQLGTFLSMQCLQEDSPSEWLLLTLWWTNIAMENGHL